MVDLIAENDEDMRELLDFLHGECPEEPKRAFIINYGRLLTGHLVQNTTKSVYLKIRTIVWPFQRPSQSKSLTNVFS